LWDGRLRPDKIFREKIGSESAEAVEGLAGKITIQQNDVTPILFGHVAIGGDEAVDTAS